MAVSWLLALGWVARALEWFAYSGKIPDLRKISDNLPGLPVADGPQLTVIVPACNEEASIERTLRSLMASEGVRLQVIAVNDRSTDQTGAVMERVASDVHSDQHSIEVMHISELPEGWLGKPHALAMAADRARAEWILFTDGDVVFAPAALELALRFAVTEEADHLVMMPEWTIASPGEAVMHGAMHALSTWTLRLWRIPDAETKDFLGVGAFNLMRRTSYEKLGGFRTLRMEVLEDIRLGWLVKRAGMAQRIALGRGLASVRWAHSAWGVVKNLEKNLFALYRYRIGLVSVASFGVAVQIVLPVWAIAAGGWARVAGIVTYAAIALLYVQARRVTRVPPGYVLLYPLGAGLLLFAIVRSVSLALVRGGIVWRGTLYPLRELRAHAGKFWSA